MKVGSYIYLLVVCPSSLIRWIMPSVQVINKPDFTVDDASCKEHTGKTFAEWFEELDKVDGLKKGRRESIVHLT